MVEPDGPRLPCHRRGNHVDNQTLTEPNGKPLGSEPLAEQIANDHSGVAAGQATR